MRHWWEVAAKKKQAEPPRQRAVAYYRHSAHNRQESSIPIQQEQVSGWAEENGVDIGESHVRITCGENHRQESPGYHRDSNPTANERQEEHA